MEVLITGGHGQLGKELNRQLRALYSVFCLGKEELDVTNKEEVEKVIKRYKPQIIIHAAAMTAVDQCEQDRKKAFEVNGIGTGYVAQAANKINAHMIYISSDYVFDGKKRSPYKEADEPNPQSAYGMSKWLGEKLVLSLNHGTVIRTSWLFGHDGNNFVNTMLDLAKKGRKIRVVNDQTGSPTYVNDLAEAIIQLFKKKNGIYHVSNSGSCTWYEFARSIFQEAGYDPNLIQPVTTNDYKSPAPRPHYSVMDYDALVRENVKPLRSWKEALSAFMRKEIK